MATDDDVYVNSGASYDGDTTYYPTLPLERQEEESKAGAILAASYPVMESVHGWFQEQIEATDSRRNIAAYATAHGTELESTARAFDIVRELLEAKQGEFETWKQEP